MTHFESQKTYSFDTLAPAILSASFKNVTKVGELSYELAMQKENIALQYRQIFPSLPVGTLDSPEKAIYHVFKTEAKEYVVICEQWINLNTIVLVEGVSFSIHFEKGSAQQIQEIRELLIAAEHNNFVIK